MRLAVAFAAMLFFRAAPILARTPSLDNPRQLEALTAGGEVSSGGVRAGDPPVAGRGGCRTRESPLVGGLTWLVDHQMPDGSWRFEPGDPPEKSRFPRPGAWRSETGATGVALLAFLGVGQTHKTGKYSHVVKAGLRFLLQRGRFHRGAAGEEDTLDLRGEGGELVWHAVATLVLCETYAMSHDRGLHGPAQAALRFLVAGQDTTTGAWATKAYRLPDLTTTAWAVTALKSGQMAHLKVSSKSLRSAFKSLERFQSRDGASFGRTGPGNDAAATAMGLFCRGHLGWQPDSPALKRGVGYVAETVPLENDAAGNYFARLLLVRNSMHEAMRRQRDRITRAQVAGGPNRGSWWNPRDAQAAGGGRLFQTALNTATAGIRFKLGIYRSGNDDENFPD